MTRINPADLEQLQQGIPPSDPALLTQMTLGREVWLDRVQDHYLENYLAHGGSKVKVLVGDAGTGKTHLLRSVAQDAQALGYATVYLSARDYKLNDLPGLYRAIVSQLDLDGLVQGLCRYVAAKLGYGPDRYDGQGSLVPLICEEQLLTRDQAIREINRAKAKAFHTIDLGTSFRTLAHHVITSHLIHGNEADLALGLKWLRGEKLERHEKQITHLFERLSRTTARAWLNCLIRLLQLAGKRGLVVAIDDLEVLTEHSPITGRFIYTPNAIKDVCELFRQLIDDVELLSHFLLLLAGRPPLINDEKRGVKSYEALWMRLQTGLVPIGKFNPLADIVDTDAHLLANGCDFAEAVHGKLLTLFSDANLPLELNYDQVPDLSEQGPLRSAVIKATLMVESALTPSPSPRTGEGS